jgi:hypothetical protein
MADDELDFDPTELEKPEPKASPYAMQTTALPQGYAQTGFDDETIKTNDLEFYKGRKGITDRIAVLSPRIITVRTHYDERYKTLGQIVCLSEYTRQGDIDMIAKTGACCEVLPEPRRRFGALVCQYHTDNKGAMVKPFGFTLRLWRFSDDKYVALRSINSEFPLAEHDLLVTCEDEAYQRMQFTACRESVARREDFQKRFGAAVSQWINTVTPRVIKSLGHTYKAQELLAKLGQTAPTPASSDAGPVMDLKDLIGG